MHQNDYYFTNSFGAILTDIGRELVRQQLRSLSCPVCGGKMYLVSMMECNFVDCLDHKYLDDPSYIPGSTGEACHPKFDIIRTPEGPKVCPTKPQPRSHQ